MGRGVGGSGQTLDEVGAFKPPLLGLPLEMRGEATPPPPADRI
jgi:hypothetical protein